MKHLNTYITEYIIKKKLDSKLEIPLFHGDFKYYPNKVEHDYNTSLTIDTLQFFFI